MAEAAKIQEQDELAALRRELSAAVSAAGDMQALEEVRVTALGKKGRITEQMKTLGALPPEARKARGAALNVIKDEIAAQIDGRQKELAKTGLAAKLEAERIDVTLS